MRTSQQTPLIIDTVQEGHKPMHSLYHLKVMLSRPIDI